MKIKVFAFCLIFLLSVVSSFACDCMEGPSNQERFDNAKSIALVKVIEVIEKAKNPNIKAPIKVKVKILKIYKGDQKSLNRTLYMGSSLGGGSCQSFAPFNDSELIIQDYENFIDKDKTYVKGVCAQFWSPTI